MLMAKTALQSPPLSYPIVENCQERCDCHNKGKDIAATLKKKHFLFAWFLVTGRYSFPVDFSCAINAVCKGCY